MKFKYGTYEHDEDLVKVSVRQNVIRDEHHNALMTRKNLSVAGAISATTQAAFETAIDALEDAYSVQNQDAGLYDDAGDPTPHFLDNSISYDGVRVLSLNWVGDSPAEYATLRSFEIELEADYLVAGALKYEIYTETTQITGTGGARNVLVELLTGTPQTQTVNVATISTAVQSGQAVTLIGNPIVPAPLWPQYEDLTARVVSKLTRTLGNRTQRSWSYSFQSPIPLILS